MKREQTRRVISSLYGTVYDTRISPALDLCESDNTTPPSTYVLPVNRIVMSKFTYGHVRQELGCPPSEALASSPQLLGIDVSFDNDLPDGMFFAAYAVRGGEV